MKYYLTEDTETTGTSEDSLLIQVAFVPMSEEGTLKEDLAKEWLIKCLSFEELYPTLNDFCRKNNESIITLAHEKGQDKDVVKQEIEDYLSSAPIKELFDGKKPTLYGKSISALDLPKMVQTFGWDWTRNQFNHRVFDLGSVVMHLVNKGLLPAECESIDKLASYLGLGKVSHLALDDCRQIADIYKKIKDL